MVKSFLWIVDHPVLTSLLLLLTTAWFASQLPGLEIDASAEVQMLEDDPDHLYYTATKERFGDDNLTVIWIEAEDVFSPPVLRAIKRISAAVQSLDGVKRVDSLSTVDQIKGDGDWLEIAPVLKQDIPHDASGLDQVREDALGTSFFVENLVANDARTAAINIHLSRDATGEAFNRRFTREIETIIDRERPPGANVSYIGPPLVKVTIVDYITKDWSVLIPAGIIILLCILYFVFRAAHAVLIPVATSVISIVWGLGIMATLGYAVNVVSWVIPSLLIIVGFTEDVHLISEYDAARERGEDKETALRTMMRAMGLPILITSITTAVGFGSLATSPIRMFVEFGHVTALAFVLNFFVTVILVPAMLRYWPPAREAKRPVRRGWGTRRFLATSLANLGELNIRRRFAILVAAGAAFAISLLGAQEVRVDAGLLSHFRHGSPLLERTRELHESLAGALGFYVVVDTKQRNGIKEPAVLEKVDALQRFLAGSAMVDKTLSVTDYLEKIHREMNSGTAANALPDSRELVAQYLLLLDGPEISQFVDHEYAATNILVRHNIINAWELTQLIDGLEHYIAEHFDGPIEVRYTGQDILLNNAAKKLSVTLVTGLSYTLLAVALVNMFLFRSFKVGLVSLVPNLLPVLSYLGFMGFFDIPLNTGTAMIAPIAVGIAVDDTVHYMIRYRNEHAKLGDEALATVATLRGEGPPIVTTSVGLAAGFLVLLFSNFLTMSHFGLLAAVVMLIALLTDLLLTPVLVSFVKL